jgi:hypothetical protein
MFSLKNVASALLIVASAADIAVPVLVAPALVLAASTATRASAPAQIGGQPDVRQMAMQTAPQV